MSQYVKSLSSEQNLIRLIYRSHAPTAKVIAETATWMITGAAAIIGAILVNLDSVATVLDRNSLKWGLIWLSVSMLVGSFAKQCGEAHFQGMAVADELYAALESTPYSESPLNVPDNVANEVVSGYIFPLTYFAKKGFENGGADPIGGLKRLTKLFSITIFLTWIQNIAAVMGLIVMVEGMK
ncbi:MAG TPA: hypothetical protein VGE60_05190 [Telluria sp.]